MVLSTSQFHLKQCVQVCYPGRLPERYPRAPNRITNPPGVQFEAETEL